MLREEGAIIEVRRIVAVGRRGYSPERPMEARRYQFIDPLWGGLDEGRNHSPTHCSNSDCAGAWHMKKGDSIARLSPLVFSSFIRQ